YVMLPGMTYVWRVRTASSQTPPSESDWSAWDVRAFQTPGASSATISLQEPATGATVATVATNRPTLRWSDSNTQVFYYEVQVSKDRNFGTGPGAPFLYWEFIHGGAATPLNSYTIPSRYPLEGKATYYWRVRPRIQGDGKPVDWSVVRSFRTP
ncbi:MAG: hypothetical protein HYY02_02750, partial [Chloroflexi bacterium]|nr:hypothetical protein [Chloroflexota bacterium]